MTRRRSSSRQTGGFINPEALILYAIFLIIAAALIPIFVRLHWRWTAIPLALISLVLGGIMVEEERCFRGWKFAAWALFGVLAMTGLGVYILAFK